MKKNWKFYLGIVLFSYSWLPYIFVFIIEPFLGFSTTALLSISSILLISSEVAFAISIVLLGKDFVKMIKSKIKGWFSRKEEHPISKPISRLRFRIGIILFVISLSIPSVFAEIVFYFNFIDIFGMNNILYALFSFDIIFISSLFILGGEFIDKLRDLFTYSNLTINK